MPEFVDTYWNRIALNLQSSGQFFPVLRAANSLVLMCLALSGMFLSIMILEPVSREFNVGRGQGALPYTLYMIGFSAGNILLALDKFFAGRDPHTVQVYSVILNPLS